jgi:hypothetical protein
VKYPVNEPQIEGLWVVDQCIDINCQASELWPWLAQMGNGRAGWYSHDWLDNLGKKSFEHLDPVMVKIEKNQKIPFATISDFAVNQFITYQFGSRASVTYWLEPLGETTRLWSRMRVVRAGWALKMILGPGHSFMQTKQFKEIKKRVEKKDSLASKIEKDKIMERIEKEKGSG